MKDEIKKPITVAKDDYFKGLVQLTNDSNLPLFVVEYVIKDFFDQIHIASQQQLESDRQKYQEELYKADKSKDGGNQ